MQEAASAILRTKFVNQFSGQATFGGAQCIGVPFRRISVFCGYKGGLTAHGETHIAFDQLCVDLIA